MKTEENISEKTLSESNFYIDKSSTFEPTSITRVSNINPPIILDMAKGAYIFDVQGKKYLDMSSAFGVSFLGHNDDDVISTIREQSSKLVHSMGDICISKSRILFSEMLVNIFGRQKDSQVLYANSGSEAVEISLKAAKLYTKKNGILAFRNSFHGQTFGALNVTGHEELRTPFKNFLNEHICFFPYPNPYRLNEVCGTKSIQEYLYLFENFIQNYENSDKSIGSIILEPIQGTNGYIIPPDEFLLGLKYISRKYNILIIMDEIFTGCGRTGKWLASDHSNFLPDILCIGKIVGGGLPFAACISTKEIFDSFRSNTFLSLHGSTFAGDPLVCEVGKTVIQKILDKNYLERCEKLGSIFLEKLHQISEKYSIIGDVRGKGLLLAIEIVTDKESKTPNALAANEIINLMRKKGILVISTGIPIGNVISFSPPVIISEKDIDFVTTSLDQILDSMKD